MPESVEMPAPVNTVIRSACSSRRRRSVSSRSSRSWRSSRTSQFTTRRPTTDAGPSKSRRPQRRGCGRTRGMGDAPYPLRAVAADELDHFFRVLSRSFGEDIRPEEIALERLTAEADRSLAAFDGDELVGTAGAFTFDLAVPGARLPAAGVTYVGVSPTHRRRGILDSMMSRQLHDIHDRG